MNNYSGKLIRVIALCLGWVSGALQGQQAVSQPFGSNPNGTGGPQAPAGMPSQVDTLRSKYLSDIQGAIKPIQDRYVLALKAYMKTLTQNGDLDGALAVREELKSAGTPQTGANGAQPGGADKAGGTGTDHSGGGGNTSQLGTMRGQYQKDLQGVIKPIQDNYIVALRALMKTLTQNGNLDEAQAAEQELKAVGSQAAPGETKETKAASFAGTVWETAHEKGSQDFSRITFRTDGTWSEAYKSNPLRGHWKPTQEGNTVEVKISNGDTIHFKMSDDGASCTRLEAACTWERKQLPGGNQ